MALTMEKVMKPKAKSKVVCRNCGVTVHPPLCEKCMAEVENKFYDALKSMSASDQYKLIGKVLKGSK